MDRSHTRVSYILVEDGRKRLHQFDGAIKEMAVDGAQDGDTPTYVRMFSAEENKTANYAEKLEALGTAMFARRPPGQPSLHGNIPAGYTYLGQFIAHELTWAKDRKGPLPENQRNPRLDLDSLFFKTGECACPHMQTGATEAIDPYPSTMHDLPRNASGRAQIADVRNDDVLPLAQTHQLMIRFYNKVARFLEAGDSEEDAQNVRKVVLQHFQSVVLNDYLTKVVDPHTYRDVMTCGRAKFLPSRLPENEPFKLPIEFVAAVFRFGHAMIRGAYPQWNRVNAASLRPFWRFTHNSRRPGHPLGPMRRLPSTWVNNWLRLFDLSRSLYEGDRCEVLNARRIDTRLAQELKEIPAHALRTQGPSTNLAVISLLRGHSLQIPCGQTVVDELNLALPRDSPIEQLTDDELVHHEPPEVVEVLQARPSSLLSRTPLWLYVLKESSERSCGNCLGPVGSRIVMEVVHGVLDHSPHSILHEKKWAPTLPCFDTTSFTMADLLAFTGDLNPIGGC